MMFHDRNMIAKCRKKKKCLYLSEESDIIEVLRIDFGTSTYKI